MSSCQIIDYCFESFKSKCPCYKRKIMWWDHIKFLVLSTTGCIFTWKKILNLGYEISKILGHEDQPSDQEVTMSAVGLGAGGKYGTI